MGVIKVLDDKTASQIAAGEVVERPASVAKELLENAIDAGATHIEVRLAGGGLEEISVIDDGRGMSPDDAVLAFSRHATSKLAAIVDLDVLGTFGFRGEALASIASVAKVSLTTREEDQDATRVVVEGSRVIAVEDAGAPTGTRVSVRELFFNVPARRKFLKKERTEVGHVDQAVRHAALANPHIGFKLTSDGRELFAVAAAPAGADLDHAARRERALLCLGKQCREHLYAIEAKTELLRVSGYLVSPLQTRRDSVGIQLAINGRPVRDRQLTGAVRAAYRTLLEVGRHPICALNLELDPALVDVNVHPQKAEVRFSEPRRVQSHVIRLLSDFLATTPWLVRAPARSYTLKTHNAQSAPLTTTTTTQVADPALAHRERVKAALSRLADRKSPRAPRPITEVPRAVPTLGGAGRFSSLRVVGQIANTFLILEGPEGMTVIDQHAAHERVVFERLRAKAGAIPTQKLLFPLQVALTELERSVLEQHQARLLEVGLEVETIGERAAMVRSVPRGLDGGRAELVVRDALSELATGDREDATGAHLDALFAKLACHGSVRAGQRMDAQEIRALLLSLDEIDLGAHCPHGRPVVRTLATDEMARWFDRR